MERHECLQGTPQPDPTYGHDKGKGACNDPKFRGGLTVKDTGAQGGLSLQITKVLPPHSTPVNPGASLKAKRRPHLTAQEAEAPWFPPDQASAHSARSRGSGRAAPWSLPWPCPMAPCVALFLETLEHALSTFHRRKEISNHIF